MTNDNDRIPKYAGSVTGILENYNTIEVFKVADKTVLFNELSDEVHRRTAWLYARARPSATRR